MTDKNKYPLSGLSKQQKDILECIYDLENKRVSCIALNRYMAKKYDKNGSRVVRDKTSVEAYSHCTNKHYASMSRSIKRLIERGLIEKHNTIYEKYKIKDVANYELTDIGLTWSHRVDLSGYGGKYLRHVWHKIENNPYYNHKWVWCRSCNKRHRVNTYVADDHKIKPIPIKCRSIEDHCWSRKDIRKIFGLGIYDHYYDDTGLFITRGEGVVIECIVCDRKGLEELMFITDREVDITATQLKEVEEYIQSIKVMEFESLKELDHKTFSSGDGIMIHIPEIDKKIREIQNIGDYVIIGHGWI